VLLTITPFERAALGLLADGSTTKQIADRLGIAESEVEARVNLLFRRMGVASPSEAIAVAQRRGLLTPGEYVVGEEQEAKLAKLA
jgi:DNA-binding NarL/FixJ family response regulator